MFENIREDFDTNGRRLRNRALWALWVYRFGRWAQDLKLTPLRWITGKVYGVLIVVSPIVTGVFLDRGTRIGHRLHIVHPGLIVIHPNAVLGDRVGIMHGVTLGENMQGQVPRVGNDVFLGAGAKIIGNVTLGDRAQVAANSLVIADVPPGMLAMGVPAKNYPLTPPKPPPSAPRFREAAEALHV
jgi:serine O-acetyltransferase